MKRREARAARRGWRRRDAWAAAASACFWLSRPAASFGTRTAGRLRCASEWSGNRRTLVCSTRARMRSNACIRLEWEILQEGQSSACREEEPLGEALARSVRAVTGEAPRFEMCPGLLEIRFYAAQGVPAYAYGPGLLSVAHGPDEYVDLRKMTNCAAIYALTAIEMLTQ